MILNKQALDKMASEMIPRPVLALMQWLADPSTSSVEMQLAFALFVQAMQARLAAESMDKQLTPVTQEASLATLQAQAVAEVKAAAAKEFGEEKVAGMFPADAPTGPVPARRGRPPAAARANASAEAPAPMGGPPPPPPPPMPPPQVAPAAVLTMPLPQPAAPPPPLPPPAVLPPAPAAQVNVAVANDAPGIGQIPHPGQAPNLPAGLAPAVAPPVATAPPPPPMPVGMPPPMPNIAGLPPWPVR